MRTTWDSLIITAAVTLICTLLIYRDAWALTSLRLGKPAPAASVSTWTGCA